jgi:hypothetical protein
LKATNAADFKNVILTKTPGQARRAGKKIVQRADWDKIKLAVMDLCLRLKFQIPEMREKLVATGDAELIEGNHWGMLIGELIYEAKKGKIILVNC